MKTAVRYYSKLGGTKKIAEAIAEGAGVKAVFLRAYDADQSASGRRKGFRKEGT